MARTITALADALNLRCPSLTDGSLNYVDDDIAIFEQKFRYFGLPFTTTDKAITVDYKVDGEVKTLTMALDQNAMQGYHRDGLLKLLGYFFSQEGFKQ
jgi:hypothetical protein